MTITQSTIKTSFSPKILSPLVALSIAMVLLVVAGCTKPPTVPFTSPADGATEVAVDTTIQIGFSTAMDLVSTIDPANWSVTSSIFGEISVVGALSEDARVLTLTPAASFAEGAVVTVVISDRVKTAVYVPIDEIQIHFTIEGAGADPGDFETGDDEFSIIQLLPAQGARSVPVRPSVSASFDLPYQTSSVSSSVVVQGTRTGSRNPQFSFPGESGGLSDTLQMLIPGNTPELHPGEWLQIVYTADLASQIQPDEDEPRFLDPYVVRFRAHLGHATGGLGPQEPLIAGGTDALLFADLGDFLPYSGLEMLLIGNDGQLSLLRGGVTGEASSWTVQSQLQLDSLPSAAVLVDFDGDSRTEAVIACIDGTLRTVGVVGQELVEEDDPMDLAGVVIDVLEWSELDGDGNPDLLAGSADGLRIIRQVTTFDLETLEFTTALSITGLMPFAAPVDSISVADLDRDGRLDAVVSAGEGVFLRGAGNGTFLVSGLLSPAPAGKISLGDVNGDGWIDAVATASSGLSIHLHPGVPIEGDWPGIPFVTGGLVQDLSVSEVDGDPAGIDDIVVLQTGSADPLILFNRMSPDLADSVVNSLPYSRNPQGGRILLVDSDGDRGTDVLVRQESAEASGAVALWRSAAVVDSGESELSYVLPAQVITGPGEPAIELPLAASFEQDISRFSIAIQFDQSLLQLVGIDADVDTFPFGSVDVTEYIDQENGVAAAELAINGYISASDDLPVARLVFQPQPGVLGEASYQLVDGLLVDGISYSNQAILNADGALIAADISGAQGVVSIESTTPAPEDVTCVASSVGGSDEVILQWSNPITYDQQGGIEIRKNGVLLATLSGSTTSYSDSDPGSGALSYSLVGIFVGVQSISVSCDVVLISAPVVDCDRDSNLPERVILVWGFMTGTSNWELMRDGNVIATLSPLVSSYSDDTDLNAHQYELRSIQQGVPSAPGTCAVGDAGGSGTVPPSQVSAALIGADDVKLTWFNGEAYDQVTVLAEGFVVATLSGTSTEYQLDDQFPGPVIYSVQAFGDGGNSAIVNAPEVDVPLAPPSGFSCSSDGPDILLEWENGPQAFQYSEIVVERTNDGISESFNLSGLATSFADSVGQGEWTYQITAYYFYQGVYHSAAGGSCQVSISNSVYYDESVAVIGRPFSVDVRGQILESVSAWTLQIDYDGSRLQNLTVQVPDVPSSSVTTNDVPLGTFEGLRRLTVLVTDADLVSSSGVLLAQVSGSVEADFSILGQALFHLVDATFETSSGGGVITPQLSDGGLTIVGNALFMDGAVITPGDEIVVWARGVWSQPLTGYVVALNWDPTLLTCLEVSNVGTVGEDLSGTFAVFFSGIDASAGTAYGSVISPFNAIAESLGDELCYFRFLVASAAPEGLTTSILFGPHETTNSTIENGFVDQTASTIVPETLGADFVIFSDPQAPTLLSIDPDQGPVAGGTDVLFNGTSFTPDTTVFFGDQPANSVIFVDIGTILATTPGASSEGAVDVSVFTSYGSAVLSQGFTYFQTTIDSYSPTEASICGSVTMTVLGSELPADLGVLFGGVASVQVQVPEATMATVLVPPSYITGPVDLVFVDGFGNEIASFPGGFTYFDDGIFIRGDVSCDGAVNLADVSAIAAYVAGAGAVPVVLDAADIDDDGVVHIGDAVLLANFLFSGGAPPAAPYPGAGTDPTPDGL
ncbi:MAG: Ig-like domain-containing protein [Planctomycetota bacterium]|nr:Ig-like domain-containing protein [Planctomycetota bacterium]